MSELTNKLKYISDWLESINPDFVDCYNPGLSRQQIDEIIKDLPFKLSEEVYELYEWANGMANYAPIEFLFSEQLLSGSTISFCHLQNSVSIYNTLRQATNYDDEYWNPKWFPIAALETKRMLYVIGDIEVSPVYLWDVNCLENSVRTYKNLTSMISMITECCELYLYQILPNPYGYGKDDEKVIRIDEEKLELEKEIYRKYNS